MIVGCGNMRASPKWHAVDTTIALENMVLVATGEGIGTCWIGSFNEEDVKRLLKIPEDLRVVAMLAVGYPREMGLMAKAVQSVKSNLRGFLVGLGAMTSDATFLVITYYLGRLIIIDDRVRGIFSALSCVLMAYLAYLTLRSSRDVDSIMNRGERKVHLPYLTGLSIGLTNPFQITWWMSVGLSLISSIGLVIIAGFFAGILMWITLFPTVMHWANKRIPQMYRVVIYVSSVLLVAFSVWFLYNTITILMRMFG